MILRDPKRCGHHIIHDFSVVCIVELIMKIIEDFIDPVTAYQPQGVCQTQRSCIRRGGGMNAQRRAGGLCLLAVLIAIIAKRVARNYAHEHRVIGCRPSKNIRLR